MEHTCLAAKRRHPHVGDPVPGLQLSPSPRATFHASSISPATQVPAVPGGHGELLLLSGRGMGFGQEEEIPSLAQRCLLRKVRAAGSAHDRSLKLV